MGYPRPVGVNPQALRGVGSQVAESADALRSASSRRVDGLPVGGAEGWASGSAAKGAAGVWSAFLARLAGEVGGLASDLQGAAAGYEQSDQAAAHRLGLPR